VRRGGRVTADEQQVRGRVDGGEVDREARACAGALGERDVHGCERAHSASGEGECAHDHGAVEALARRVVLDVAVVRTGCAARGHHVCQQRAAIEVVQRLPPAADHLPWRGGAVLERAPAARRPDLVELPHEQPELVLRAARLDVALHVQRLREHALVELPLEGGLARLVEVPGRLRPKVDQYE